MGVPTPPGLYLTSEILAEDETTLPTVPRVILSSAQISLVKAGGRIIESERLKNFSTRNGKTLTVKHWWFSGRILACHAGGPGSIPGQCSFAKFLFFSTTYRIR